MVAIPRAILVVLSGIALLPAGAVASGLGLMPRALSVNHPSQQLTPEQAFDALDEVEAVGGPAAATPDRERRHSFVEESTGQTAEGVVVKGTRLDLKGLAPGFYELRVVVFDAVRGVEMSRSLGFEIVGDASAKS